MGFCQKLGNGIKIFDFFYSTQILRYNNNAQYKTLTGGLISLAIIVATIIGFSNRIKILFEKTQIFSTFDVITEVDPPFIDLIPGKDNFIMVFVVLDYATGQPIDLNKGPQLFNIFESRISFQKGVLQSDNQQQLGEPCALSYIDNIVTSDPTYKQTFTNIYPFAKCLKLNESYSIGGQRASQKYKFMTFKLNQCLNTTVNNNKCAPKSQIDSQLSQSNKFQFMVTYLNPIINPNRRNHIEYYVNTENRFVVLNKIGQMTTLKLSDFAISTDTSILPFETFIEEKGLFIEERSIVQPFDKSSINIPFVIIRMIKSSRSLVYNRSFLKFQTVVSFIGGLVGAIVAALFIIKFYTNCSLQINIGLDLFHKSLSQNQQSKPEEIPTFNLYSFVCLYFYKLLKKIKKFDGFKQSKRLLQFEKQINYHLDITFLLRRIFTIQQFLTQSLLKEDINLMQDNISLQRAVHLRNLLKYAKKGESQSENDKEVGSNKANRLFSARQLVEIQQGGADRENNNGDKIKIGTDIILKPIVFTNTEQQNQYSQWELKRQNQDRYQRNNHKQTNVLEEKKQSKHPTDSLGRQEK